MDFVRELRAAQSFLGERGYRSAVIGGVALAAYGHPRLTLDLDVVTEAAAQDSLVGRMESKCTSVARQPSAYSPVSGSCRGREARQLAYPDQSI